MPDETQPPAESTQTPAHESISPPPIESPVEQEGSTGQAFPEPVAKPIAPEPVPAEPPVDTSSTGQATPSEPEIPPAEVPALPASTPAPAEPAPTPPTLTQKARDLLSRANFALQTGKQKKFDKILAEIVKRGQIDNDDVQKLLRCSHATATRYLLTLEKQGRLRKIGKGRALHYEKA